MADTSSLTFTQMLQLVIVGASQGTGAQDVRDIIASMETISDTKLTTAQVNILIAAAGHLATTGGAMTGAIAMGASKITGVLDPTADQDAATKKYVDDNAGGGGEVVVGHAPSRWYGPITNESATTAVIAFNTAYAIPWVLHGGVTYDRIGVYATVGHANARWRLGFYADDGTGYYPGAKIESNAVETTPNPAGWKDYALAAPYTPAADELVWLAVAIMVNSTARPARTGIVGDKYDLGLTNAAPSSADDAYRGYRVGHAGPADLPATFPVIAGASLMLWDQCPRLMIQAQ